MGRVCKKRTIMKFNNSLFFFASKYENYDIILVLFVGGYHKKTKVKLLNNVRR